MRLVVILSPFAGQQRRNIEYARRAMLDSLKRGEAPYASHLLLPQVLNDLKAKDREMGMEVGRAWMACADAVVVYADLGLSAGMLRDLEGARLAGLEVDVRMIGKAKRRRKPKAKPAPEKPAETTATATAASKAPRRTREQLQDATMAAIHDAPGGVTRSNLRKELGCSGATLGRVLADLVTGGHVQETTKGKQTRYQGGMMKYIRGAASDPVTDAVADVVEP